MQLDCAIAKLVEEVGLPVHLETRRIERIKHALQRGPGDRAGGVDRWSLERADGRETLLGLVEVAGVAPDNCTHLLQVKLLGEWRRGWHGNKGKPAVNVFRSVQDEIAPVWQDCGGLFQRPEHWPTVDRANRMQPEQER